MITPTRLSLALTLVFSGVALCQISAPTFQSAAIHTSAGKPGTFQATYHDGVFQIRSATMNDLIGISYEAHPDRLVNAPRWFSQDRFDVVANAPAGTSAETVQQMLRTLLADRFGLVFHGGEKSTSAFFLTTGKGEPKMKRSDGAGGSGCTLERMSRDVGVDNTYVCHNVTMASFATQLRDMASTYLTEPVVDETHLKGSWDFVIAWTSKGSLGRIAGGLSVFDAIDSQLGLKLTEDRRSLPIFVVEHAEKPTPDGV